MIAMRPNRNKKSEPIAALIIWLLLTGVGVVVSSCSWSKVSESHAIRAGLTAPATLLSATVVKHRGSKGGTTYEATALFQFYYQGRQYQGNRIGIDMSSFFSESNATAYVQGLQTAPLTAYFQASEPSRAVLDPRVGDETAIGLLVGSGLASVTTLAIVLFPPRKRFPDDTLPMWTTRTENGYITYANRGGPRVWVVLGLGLGGGAAVFTWIMAKAPGTAFSDSTLAMISSLPPVLAGIGYVFIKLFVPRTSGAVLIDEHSQTISLLGWRGRVDAPQRVVPFADVIGVGMKFRVRGQKGAPDQYSPVLRLADESEVVLKRQCFVQASAEEFVAWLREVLALEAAEV